MAWFSPVNGKNQATLESAMTGTPTEQVSDKIRNLSGQKDRAGQTLIFDEEDSALEPAQKMTTPLEKTALWPLHISLGARMVPFAGYDMPVQYGDMGVLKEHIHTRTAAGLFDVSHMGQCVLHTQDIDSLHTQDIDPLHTQSADSAIALEEIVPGDIQNLALGQMRYTVLLNDKGGIIDDLMVTRWDEKTLFLIVNAACKDKDFAYIKKMIGAKTTLDYLADRALLALQGPKAEDVLKTFFPAVTDMVFMTAIKADYKGQEFFISRSGYTGEDGFEISLAATCAESFAKELLAHEAVKCIGLGARDSLRLEAGLCLYGHDLDETTSPIEANLKWTVPKRRREAGQFAGAETILKQFKDGTARLRVGIKPEGRAPLREGTELFAENGNKIGIITSGGFGPTYDAPVAMGYVETAFAKTGTKLHALLRGTARPCEVVAMPFVPQNYKKS